MHIIFPINLLEVVVKSGGYQRGWVWWWILSLCSRLGFRWLYLQGGNYVVRIGCISIVYSLHVALRMTDLLLLCFPWKLLDRYSANELLLVWNHLPKWGSDIGKRAVWSPCPRQHTSSLSRISYLSQESERWLSIHFLLLIASLITIIKNQPLKHSVNITVGVDFDHHT